MAEPRAYSLWQRLQFWLGSQLGGRLARLLFRTCRIEMLNPELEAQYFDGGLPGIGVTWHRGAIFFLYYFGVHRPAIMVSRSKDGEFLARFIEINGGVPVRGSSSRGGGEALKQMCEMVRRREVLYAATVADGPRGPHRRAKAGMILLAMHTGLPLFPLGWSADRVWVFPRSWDRTIIPKPFARVKVKIGREFRFEPGLDRGQIEQARLALEEEMNRLTDELDQMTCYREPE